MKTFGTRVADFFRSLFGKQPQEPVREELPPPPEEIYVELSELIDNAPPPSAHDHFINVTLVWDLERYDLELAEIIATEDPRMRASMEFAQQMSETQTTFYSYDMMPTQAMLLKVGRSNNVARDLVETLERELPPLIEGGRPEVYDFWWVNEKGDREVLRYDPTE